MKVKQCAVQKPSMQLWTRCKRNKPKPLSNKACRVSVLEMPRLETSFGLQGEPFWRRTELQDFSHRPLDLFWMSRKTKVWIMKVSTHLHQQGVAKEKHVLACGTRTHTRPSNRTVCVNTQLTHPSTHSSSTVLSIFLAHGKLLQFMIASQNDTTTSCKATRILLLMFSFLNFSSKPLLDETLNQQYL